MSEHVPVWIQAEEMTPEDAEFLFRLSYDNTRGRLNLDATTPKVQVADDDIRGQLRRALAIRKSQSEHYMRRQLDKLTPLEDE